MTTWDDDLLAAYLADDVDEVTAARVERQLREDPAMAARLDRISEVVVALQGLDEVEPPPGYAERLRARLAAESPPVASTRVPSTAASWQRSVRPADGVAPAPSVEGAHARSGVQRSWAGLAAAAAAIVVLAVLALPRTVPEQQLAEGSAELADEAVPEALREADTEEESAAERGADAAADAAPPENSVLSQAAPAPGTPVIADVDVEVADDAALRERYAGAEDVVAARALPPDVVAEAAVRARELVAQAPPFADGLSPAACAPAALPPSPAALVVRVEAIRFAGARALAYVTVLPGASDTPASAQVTVVDPACTTIAAVALPQ